MMPDHKVIYVPGKNPKPEPGLHRERLLQCAMHGLQPDYPEVADELASGDVFELCAWNHAFYGKHADPGDDQQFIEALLRSAGPTTRDLEEARSLRLRLARVIYSLVDRCPWLIRPLGSEHVANLLDGSTQYFENRVGIADLLRGLLRRQILAARDAGQRVLLIGHSMGSVIAYDTLWQIDSEPGSPKVVDLFLTLGSPLGLKYTQHRLLGLRGPGSGSWPAGISAWANVSARGDLVSIDRTLAGDFSGMLDSGRVGAITDYHRDVYNWYRNESGLAPHRAYGYLANPVVAGIIGDWWRTSQ